jgi:thiopurine S-methyltransferase
MDQSDWKTRWEQGQTRFHEGKPNDLLVAHAHRFGKAQRILVPLAGKAADLQWLADQGHDVVGVEFVQQAIDDFFKGRAPTPHRLGAHDAYYAQGVTLVRADMFDVKPETLGRFDAIYDRAALVAIDPPRRADYVAVCHALANRALLISFSYDQTTREGPPWSVDEAMVRALYGSVEKLAERDGETMRETAYWLA